MLALVDATRHALVKVKDFVIRAAYEGRRSSKAG
jgi:hypothetical protein